MEPIEKKCHYHKIRYQIEEEKKYSKKGRPSKDSDKVLSGYKIGSYLEENPNAIEQRLSSMGRFILATNNLDEQQLPDTLIFHHYKEQQSVEGGFRFLKDPWFLLDSFYVKKNSQIEALMVVMALCLFVYNYGQYRLRKNLLTKQETLPNQKNQEIQKPTLKWVFQIMEGINIIKIKDRVTNKTRSIITNLTHLRKKIIILMGITACKIYGIEEHFAGM